MDGTTSHDSCVSAPDSPCQQERRFPVDRAYEVIIHHIDDGFLWVMLSSEAPMLNILSDTLNKDRELVKVSNPHVGQVVCALNVDDTWYRARILRIEPDICVRFIDFGDTLTVVSDNLSPLPEALDVIQPLAMKVQLPLDCTIQPIVGGTFRAKQVAYMNGVEVVDIVDEESQEVTANPDGEDLLKSNVPNDTLLADPLDSTKNLSEHFKCKSEDFDDAALEKPDLAPLDSASTEVDNIGIVDESQIGIVPSIDSGTELKISTSNPNASETSCEVSECKENNEEGNNFKNDSLILSAAECYVRSVSIECEPCEVLKEPETEDIPIVKECFETDLPNSSYFVSKASISSGIEVIVPNNAGVLAQEPSNETANTQPCSPRDNSLDDPFMSALDRYPHLGGGYGQDNSSYSTYSQSSEETTNEYLYAEQSGLSSYHSSVNNKSTKRPVPITKGRNLQSHRPPCPQEYSAPSNNSFAQSKSSARNLCGKAPQNISVSNTSQDFKTVLELELAIIREQNRLQMLQLQKKMEQTASNQLKTIREEMTRQLAAFRNEVNSRLMVINDAVVNKMADIYSDLTMLKNDQEIMKQNTSGTALSDNLKQINFAANFSSVPINSCTEPHPSQHQQFQGDNDHGKNGYNGNYGQLPVAQHQKMRQSASTSHFHEKLPNSTKSVSSPPLNNLMALRKEKMMEREREVNLQFPHSSKHIEKNSDLNSGFSGSHPSSNSYPKMDHFDPSKTGVDINGKLSNSKTGSGSIICSSNLNTEKMTPDRIFYLFSVYGIVQRIKISQQDKGRAFIEMGDSAQAEQAVRYLNGVPLMGHSLHVTHCNFDQLKLYKQDFQSNTSKDYTKPQQQRMNRFKPGSWSPQKLYPPSERLMITNVLGSVSDEKIKEVFAKNGFFIQNIYSQTASNDEKKTIFATMSSVEEAVTALTVLHLHELSDWMLMRISFAKSDKRSSSY